MANTIYIQRVGGDSTDDIFQSPLLEDIDLHTGSEFQSLAEMAPKVDDLINLANTFTTGVNNKLTGVGYDLRNIMDYAMWKRTPPIEITTTLSFFTKSDTFKDVVKPTYTICGLAVLSRDPSSRSGWLVPGVSLDLIKIINEASEEQKEQIGSQKVTKQNSKLVSVLIPGIIHLPVALVQQCNPQYSKHITEKGYPLWSKVTCTFMGLSPAKDEDFINGSKYRWSEATDEIYDATLSNLGRGV